MYDPMLTEAFMSAGGLAALVVAIVAALRAQLPELDGAGAVILSWSLGPALAIFGWFTGLTPAALSLGGALAMGLMAALVANGAYSSGKALGARRRARKAKAPERRTAGEEGL